VVAGLIGEIYFGIVENRRLSAPGRYWRGPGSLAGLMMGLGEELFSEPVIFELVPFFLFKPL
jgi:hypothetical protein